MAKRYIFCFAALAGSFMLSCGDGGSQGSLDRTGSWDEDVPTSSEPLCPRTQLTVRGTCHFILEPIGYGELFTATHKDRHDLHNINDGGAILGAGQWRCVQGKWEVVTPAKCIFCDHRLDYEQCLNKRRIPVCLFNEIGEDGRCR